MPKQLLLVSSSRCHPLAYLEHCEQPMLELFRDVREIVFVPYARPGGISFDEYTELARKRFRQVGISVSGIHEHSLPASALQNAEAVFIGGGNTFVLLHSLYEFQLLEPLQRRISAGMPYMGTSAGSNVAGLSIGTSNDMPIVRPPSFKAIGAVPFNLNPHFPVARPDPEHKGETREQRIGEFHHFNQQPVLALHEDGMLRVADSEYELIGKRNAFVFRPPQETETLVPGRITI